MRIRHYLLLISLFLPFLGNAQLTGKLTDTKGDPLRFASVYVKGTSKGTSTNDEGFYILRLDPGNYEIVFQYVGYKSETVNVIIGDKGYSLDVVLEEEALILQTVEISASAEDPAYAVIRNAIRKRKYYRDRIPEYSCQTYIKGNFMMLESPEKFMGQDIDFEGWLDSTGTGIVYLSESESMFYKREPNDVKEVMISSKVAGQNRDMGFSFNTAMALDFSFYNNDLDLVSRPLVSPIASNALGFYKYRLEGTFYDEEGKLVNKIKVIPKRDNDPVFRGDIYIYEDTWNIHSTDLMGIGKSFQNPILDTMRLQIVYVHLEDDIWVPLNKNLLINFKMLGFRIGGGFIGSFSNYDINPNLGEKFFNNEIFRVEEEANTKSLEYWDSIRPIPLNEEELSDYVKKDSLVRTWDTTTRWEGGSFKLMEGYTHYKNKRDAELRIESPLSNLSFNAVQGFYVRQPISYSYSGKDSTAQERQRNTWFGRVGYGFAETRLRWNFGYRKSFNDIGENSFGFDVGTYILDYNDRDAMTRLVNTMYSIWDKINLTKFYESDRVRAWWRGEIANGLNARVILSYAQRRGLNNHSNFSILKSDQPYRPNTPLDTEGTGGEFIPEHNALISEITLSYQPGMRYFSYPNQKVEVGSDWPTFRMGYRKGWMALGSDVNFDLLYFGIRDQLSAGIYGSFNYNLEAGKFLNDYALIYNDYRHFDGNETFFGDPGRYSSSFFMLPYYTYSTPSSYVEAHLMHQFKGFLLDKIPLMRKLGFRSVLGLNFLYTEELKDYYELSFGLDNIGISGFRFLRVDVITQFQNGSYKDTGFMLGINLLGGIFNVD